LLHPGGPGMPPIWLEVVVVLAGLAGLLQLTRPWPARVGWLLALVGMVGGVVVTHLQVRAPGADAAVPGWPGTATALIGAGILVSAAVAGARLRARLTATSFGWRQPVALVMAVAAVATPVAAAGLWLSRGAGPLLHAGDSEVLPAFIKDPDATHDQPRTIVLRPSDDGTFRYALLRDRSPQLGDADLPPDPAQVALVDAAVADLAGGFGEQAATELAHVGVRYVLVPLKNDGGVGARIAAAGGLLPKATDATWRVWQVESGAGRLAIASADDEEWQLPSPGATAQTTLTGDVVGRDAKPLTILYSPVARQLVLAEAPSSRWRAEVTRPGGGSTPLVATVEQGMQAFELPTVGGEVVVYRAPDDRSDWLLFQLVAVIVVLVAAIPAGRRAADQQRIARHGAGAPAAVVSSHDQVGASL